jgi:hypothetical protein
LRARGGAALPPGWTSRRCFALSGDRPRDAPSAADVPGVVARLAPQAPLDEALALRAAREVQQQMDSRGRPPRPG